MAEVPESVRKSTVRRPAGKLKMLYSTSRRIASRSSTVTAGRDLTTKLLCDGGGGTVVFRVKRVILKPGMKAHRNVELRVDLLLLPPSHIFGKEKGMLLYAFKDSP